ncbi:sunset domain-containing protein [Pannonibacter sp. Q-1]
MSKNGRIYHMPWSASYARTSINENKGERWFCTEAEAIAAGWRAAHSS